MLNTEKYIAEYLKLTAYINDIEGRDMDPVSKEDQLEEAKRDQVRCYSAFCDQLPLCSKQCECSYCFAVEYAAWNYPELIREVGEHCIVCIDMDAPQRLIDEIRIFGVECAPTLAGINYEVLGCNLYLGGYNNA